ncbi:MAG: hypothetical protein JW839_14725, partial [Candidatus Lokiarchaeota archaeon]|nr:hypothetical protein [Candidatus Lokiarchaeota archaeon]
MIVSIALVILHNTTGSATISTEPNTFPTTVASKVGEDGQPVFSLLHPISPADQAVELVSVLLATIVTLGILFIMARRSKIARDPGLLAIAGAILVGLFALQAYIGIGDVVTADPSSQATARIHSSCGSTTSCAMTDPLSITFQSTREGWGFVDFYNATTNSLVHRVPNMVVAGTNNFTSWIDECYGFTIGTHRLKATLNHYTFGFLRSTTILDQPFDIVAETTVIGSPSATIIERRNGSITDYFYEVKASGYLLEDDLRAVPNRSVEVWWYDEVNDAYVSKGVSNTSESGRFAKDFVINRLTSFPARFVFDFTPAEGDIYGPCSAQHETYGTKDDYNFLGPDAYDDTDTVNGTAPMPSEKLDTPSRLTCTWNWGGNRTDDLGWSYEAVSGTPITGVSDTMYYIGEFSNCKV